MCISKFRKKISQLDAYCYDVSKQHAYFARTPIGESAIVGDYGELIGKDLTRFNRHGNITEIAEDFNFIATPQPGEQRVHFWMSTSVSSTGLGGGVKVPGAKASFDLKFNAGGAAIISLSNAKIESYPNFDKVGNWLVNYYKTNSSQPDHKWKEDYALVCKVMKTESGTILVADSKGKQVTIQAMSPDIPLDLTTAQIGVDAQIFVKRTGFTKVITTNVAPFMGLIRLDFKESGDVEPVIGVATEKRISIGWEELDPRKDLTLSYPPSNGKELLD